MGKQTIIRGGGTSTSEHDADGRLELKVGIPGYPGWWVVARVNDSVDPPAVVELTLTRLKSNPLRAAFEEMGGKVTYHGPEVEIAPAITADMLRSVRFGPIVDLVHEHLARHRDVPGTPNPGEYPSGSDEHYAAVAALYTERVGAGSRRPNADLAERFGMRPSQVRDLIFTCRRRGFLTAATAGRSTGVLTEKAAEVLRSVTPTKPGRKER